MKKVKARREIEIEILEVFEQLNESNRFAVLVYARMKVALQEAALCKPYNYKIHKAHWIGGSGAG